MIISVALSLRSGLAVKMILNLIAPAATDKEHPVLLETFQGMSRTAKPLRSRHRPCVGRPTVYPGLEVYSADHPGFIWVIHRHLPSAPVVRMRLEARI